jgi:hypothetical protein
VRLVTVIEPVPLPPVLVTWMLNRVPEAVVGPQLPWPRIVPSAVYVPLPRSRTRKLVLGL